MNLSAAFGGIYEYLRGSRLNYYRCRQCADINENIGGPNELNERLCIVYSVSKYSKEKGGRVMGWQCKDCHRDLTEYYERDKSIFCEVSVMEFLDMNLP